ncbi:MAG: alpha/beta hydrolase [Sporolactobacillus sp.]
MALMTINLHSETLDLQTAVNVLIPDKLTAGEPPATLYLLHGLSGDYSSWLLKTSLLRYAENRQLTIIMPSADRSFYTDMVHGNRYWSYLTEELPAKLGSWLPLTQKRENRFVGGLSMGGYGALKWGLSAPEKFAGILSMSAAVDLAALLERSPEYRDNFESIFGNPLSFPHSDNDLFHLVDKVSDQDHPMPEILQFCGNADFLYTDNLRFKAKLDASKIPHSFHEKEAMGHEWAYWDESMQIGLDWIEQKIAAQN